MQCVNLACGGAKPAPPQVGEVVSNVPVEVAGYGTEDTLDAPPKEGQIAAARATPAGETQTPTTAKQTDGGVTGEKKKEKKAPKEQNKIAKWSVISRKRMSGGQNTV